MRSIIRIGQLLSIAIFVSGVALYLLFAIAHPLLHNHHIDGKHHPNCSACNFLATASLCIASGAAIIVAIFLQVIYKLPGDYQEPHQKPLCKTLSIRAPPKLSV